MRKATYKSVEMQVENDIFEGLSIEREMERAETAKQPISQSAPIIYTERKDGVQPQYDIRTDRFEIAQDAMGKVAASIAARRMENIAHNDTKGTAEAATEKTTTTPATEQTTTTSNSASAE